MSDLSDDQQSLRNPGVVDGDCVSVHTLGPGLPLRQEEPDLFPVDPADCEWCQRAIGLVCWPHYFRGFHDVE